MVLKKCYQIVLVSLFTFVSAGLAQPSLTVYNQDFAVVRDQLNLNLKRGINEVNVTDITAHLEPDSVILRDPKGERVIQILEQNYRADPISQGLLLSLFEGEEIEFQMREDKVIKGKVIRSGYVPHQSGMQRYGSRYTQRQYQNETMKQASFQAADHCR